jgi:hypothetical protein
MTDFRARIGIDRTEGTYERHEILYRQLKLFLREKYNIEDIPLSGLDMPFIEALDYYFRVKRSFHKSLTAEELDCLISTPLKSSTKSFIRDMFVFSTFTGVSYVDLQNLSWKDIITEDDGSRWISADRQKTKNSIQCKAIGYSCPNYGILQGLRSRWKGFPVHEHRAGQCRVKADSEELRDKYGINFPHEQILVCQSNLPVPGGVPIKSVSRMMEHKNIHTQRYARLNKEKIGRDMKELSLHLAGKFSYTE